MKSTQPCRGSCNREIRAGRFLCRPCRRSLPRSLRRRLRWSVTHVAVLDARIDAYEWLVEARDEARR